jgi:rifampicin phosphotransferase
MRGGTVTDQNWIIDTVPSTRYPVYTRLNANDVMPDPVTPLGASLVWIPEVLPAWAVGNVRMNSFTPEEMSPDPYPPVGGFFYGYLYVNQTYVRITGIRAGIGADAIDAAFFAHPNPPVHEPSPSDTNPELSAKMGELVNWTLTTTTYPDLEEERELADRVRAERPDLRTVSDEVLITLARRAAPLQRIMWGRGYVCASNQSAIGPGVISSLLGAADPTLTVRLIGQAGDVDSALPSFALWDLSRAVRADAGLTAAFDDGESGRGEEGEGDSLLDRLRKDHPDFAARFEAFTSEYGYRGPSEWDIGVHTWETQPELPLALIGRLRELDDEASPVARREQRSADTGAALQEALRILGSNEEAVQTLHLAIASSRRFGAWRERGKTNAVKVLHEVRAPLFELGRRLTERGELDHPQQVFMALESELDHLATHASVLADTLRERERQWRQLFEVEPPTFVVGGEPVTPLADVPRKGQRQLPAVKPGEVLAGAPASAGLARGRARVITSTAQIAAFEPGEILVAPQTDPSWTPLFMVAAGVVVDVGAMGSHAMIVSRELGIPCAVGVGDATARIPDGTLLEVDGSSGTVTVLEG